MNETHTNNEKKSNQKSKLPDESPTLGYLAPPPSKRALKDKEASAYIGMSISWLRHGRIEGSRLDRIPRPRFIKIGQSVRYLIEDLDAWLENFQRCEHLAQHYFEKSLKKQDHGNRQA